MPLLPKGRLLRWNRILEANWVSPVILIVRHCVDDIILDTWLCDPGRSHWQYNKYRNVVEKLKQQSESIITSFSMAMSLAELE